MSVILPFTPVRIECSRCNTSGCRLCGHRGFITIYGRGKGWVKLCG